MVGAIFRSPRDPAEFTPEGGLLKIAPTTYPYAPIRTHLPLWPLLHGQMKMVRTPLPRTLSLDSL